MYHDIKRQAVGGNLSMEYDFFIENCRKIDLANKKICGKKIICLRRP